MNGWCIISCNYDFWICNTFLNKYLLLKFDYKWRFRRSPSSVQYSLFYICKIIEKCEGTWRASLPHMKLSFWTPGSAGGVRKTYKKAWRANLLCQCTLQLFVIKMIPKIRKLSSSTFPSLSHLNVQISECEAF